MSVRAKNHLDDALAIKSKYKLIEKYIPNSSD